MPIHVLVVEDRAPEAQAISGALETAGFAVDLARNGEEALDRFDPERCRVIVSEVILPGEIDGHELCRRVKSSAGGRSTTVILLTTLSSPMDVIHGLESGVDSFLTKPYEPAQLVERLQLLIRTREARAERKVSSGIIDIVFMGRTYAITSDREQILDLLISTFEDAVRQNQALRAQQHELSVTRAELTRYAATLEARLESVLRSVPDVLFSVKSDLSVAHYFSPGSFDITGYAPEELVADLGIARRLVHPLDVPLVETGFARARQGEVVSEHFRIKHRDGTPRWLHTTVVPVFDEQGWVTGFDGIARDITASRRTEEQLRHAQKMESVGRLAGGVAHDFNNLLSVILGWTGMALEELPADSSVRESLQEVVRAGEGAASLTKQLLAFSRQQIVEPTLFNANALVAEMNKMLRRLIGEDVELITGTDPDLGLVLMDRGQLEQVLVNLVVNARDAMPEGGTLTIETRNVVLDADYPLKAEDVKPGEYVMLSVSDSGTGMTEEVKARLFEPFFTTKRERGTGLGLATCYGIVKQAGGHIQAYSELGVGSTIKVYLRLRHEDTAPGPRRRRKTPIRGGETILLVEDEGAVRRVATRMLETHGFRVLGVSDGDEALRILAEGKESVQLLLTDVVLAGGMNGRELADHVRERWPRLKVLYTSGYTSDVAILHGILDGGVALVQKPFTAESLGRKVRDVLDGK